jgi:Zn finger protein HypA/HybF involved in hydrogenase expression
VAIANCPSCGGPIEFKIGSSVVVVCDHCRSVVARTDGGLEDLGKVAALVDTGSPLRRDLPGRIRGNGFRIVGRTQMQHPMGGVWDEWYAAFDDGQWGWLAEAQGKYYLTVKTAKGNLPPYEVLQIGGMFDGMKVVELATATTISGEGEIPFRVEPGGTYPYADLAGPNRRFGTIDYSEDPPLLFEGEETTLADLGINVALEPGRTTTVRVTKLSCSQCGGPLTLVAPDQAERVICPHCGAAHDITQGNLRYLETLKRHGPRPLIALGASGKIADEAYVVAGFMQRSVTFDEEKFYWNEYLLFAPRTKSFAWLVDDDAHWSFVTPLSAGDVDDSEPAGAARRITAHQKTFAIFQDSVATVESVIGEFYWKVQLGETARAVDYIAPPEGITKEFSDTAQSHEVNYSLARYMPPEEVESAFGISGLPRSKKIGSLQPIVKSGCGPLAAIWGMLAAALILASIIVAASLPHRVVLSDRYPLDQYAAPSEAATSTTSPAGTSSGDWSSSQTTTTTTTTATPPGADHSDASAVIFSKPFVVNGGHNLEVEASTDLSEAWLHIDGSLFNEQSGFVEPFQMQLEHYTGIDDGERWTEGSLSAKKDFSTLKPGTYSLRLETYRDATKPPPTLDVKVTEGVYSSTGCAFLVAAMMLITLPAFFTFLRTRGGSESERWADAMFTPQGELNE